MSNAHIDKASVEQLRNNFSRNSGAINSSLNSVENYLRDIQSSIKQDLQVIYERLKKAEEKLSAAEAALDRCERSQKWGEEKNEYRLPRRLSCFCMDEYDGRRKSFLRIF